MQPTHVVSLAFLVHHLYLVNCQSSVDGYGMTIVYNNPSSRQSNGRMCDFWSWDIKCDVYLRVCVSSRPGGKCNILNWKTEFKWNTNFLKEQTFFNGIRETSSRYVKIQVEVWDFDAVTNHDLIAKFDSVDFNVEDVNKLITNIPMERVDLESKNDVKLQVSMWKRI